MPQFDRERPESRDVMISMRVTAEEAEWMTSTADRLGLKSRAELLRAALDFWQERSPEARKLPKGKG